MSENRHSVPIGADDLQALIEVVGSNDFVSSVFLTGEPAQILALDGLQFAIKQIEVFPHLTEEMADLTDETVSFTVYGVMSDLDNSGWSHTKMMLMASDLESAKIELARLIASADDE